MSTTISLRDANQGFARCVRAVEGGEEFVITRNGKPVARLVPILDSDGMTAKHAAAWARIETRMQEGLPLGGETFDRNALYDDG